MSLTKVTYSMIQGAFVNALDYGAKGDGTTDDTAALQAAATAAAYGTLFIPKGTYKVTSTVNLPRSINVKGAGQDATIIQGYTLSATTAMFYAYGDLCTLTDLQFKGSASGSNAVGLKTYLGYTNTYRNIYFLNCATGMQMDESGGCLIDSCLFFNCTTGALCTGGSGYTFMLGQFSLNTTTGIKLDVSPTSAASTAVYVRQSFFSSEVGVEVPKAEHTLYCDNSYFEGYSAINKLRPFKIGQTGAGLDNVNVTITNCQIANTNCISSLIDSVRSVVIGGNQWGQPIIIGSTCTEVFDYGDTYYLAAYWQNSCVQTTRINSGLLSPYRLKTIWFDNDTDGESSAYIRNTAGAGYRAMTDRFIPLADGTQYLGDSSHRWNTVYATTGTINTSDASQKQQIRALTDAERAVAARLKSLIRAFKFNNAVAAKGDAARIHVGIVAQEVKAAFHVEGLDAEQYGMFCSDTLEDGSKRLGVRYDELLAFIVGAM
jgi:hypothetical protein